MHGVLFRAGRAASKLRIIQTNFAGDTIHIIDPATNKVVGEIKGIEATHGIASLPDGSRIYVSEEADNTLTVVDGKTLQVTKTNSAEREPQPCRHHAGWEKDLCRDRADL